MTPCTIIIQVCDSPMSRKHPKKHEQKTFAKMVAGLGVPKFVADPGVGPEAPKIDTSTEKSVDNELGNYPFRWCFIADEMRWNDNFGFKDYKQNLQKFLQDIEKTIYEKFHNMTWAQVDKLPHCGKYGKNLNKKQQAIACSPYKPDDEQLYHIHISQKHVLLGYRIDNIFHITINDPEHGFDKL